MSLQTLKESYVAQMVCKIVCSPKLY